MRILYAVQRQKESPPGSIRRDREEILKLQQPAFPQEGDHALMHLCPSMSSQLVAGFGVHADSGRPRQVQQPGQPGVLAAFALASDRNVVDSLWAGAQRLFHRVQTVENLHPPSVRG
jgi:hypothetical protein